MDVPESGGEGRQHQHRSKRGDAVEREIGERGHPAQRGVIETGHPLLDDGHEVDEQRLDTDPRSEEHTSELQSLMRISYAVFCLKKKKKIIMKHNKNQNMSK